MTKNQKLLTRLLWLLVLILRPFDMYAYASYFNNTAPWYMYITALYVVFHLFLGIYALFGELPLTKQETIAKHELYIQWLIEELEEEWYRVLPPQTN